MLTKIKSKPLAKSVNHKNLYKLVTIKKAFSSQDSRYAEAMHEAWTKDPTSVHESWRKYFETIEGQEFKLILGGGSEKKSDVRDAINIFQLIRAYQKIGYLKANINPLKLTEYSHFPLLKNIKNLNYASLGFREEDLQREFLIPYHGSMAGFVKQQNKRVKLIDLIEILEKCYCGSIGIEFMHISNREELNFIADYMENRWLNYTMKKEDKIKLYKKLALATKFEKFCDVKFTTKRFGLEGLETLITGLDRYFNCLSEKGVKDITLGMAHRGRLNVMANLFGKPMNNIFKEFLGKSIDDQGLTTWKSGDVKYHLGYSSTKKMDCGRTLSMEILCNPSHLECINPVVQGKVRAKQHINGDYTREDYQGVVVHGDAAFSGQGVNFENFQMNSLENFATGGLLHVIANNQIGFTTTPKDGRSTFLPTDIGKAYDSPIIHVNADDPIAVDFAFNMAANYARKYPKDIIVDLVGYRKHGHNELDEPMFTQQYDQITFPNIRYL